MKMKLAEVPAPNKSQLTAVFPTNGFGALVKARRRYLVTQVKEKFGVRTPARVSSLIESTGPAATSFGRELGGKISMDLAISLYNKLRKR
jgi:hypothetical protein